MQCQSMSDDDGDGDGNHGWRWSVVAADLEDFDTNRGILDRKWLSKIERTAIPQASTTEQSSSSSAREECDTGESEDKVQCSIECRESVMAEWLGVAMAYRSLLSNLR